jgi:hypothetical protein
LGLSVRALIAAVLVVPLLGCSLGARIQPGADATLTPFETVGLEAAVREYFHVRKKALLAGDPQVLWKRYPELAQGMELGAGVNAERIAVESAKALRPIDIDFDLESYERISYELSGLNAQATVHGLEMYLLPDFKPSGGEFKVTLYLRLGSDRWHVVRTDAVTLGEWHEQHR